MKYLIVVLLFSYSTSFGQKQKTIDKTSSCKILVNEGYTQEFCNYDQQYEFKSIPFESKFNLLDSLMNLKRVEYYSNVYDIQNEKYIDWGITKFTRGYVQFSNNKFISVTLDLMDDKGIPFYKFETILKYFTELFGTPKIIKTSNPNITLHEWHGNKLTIDIHYFDPRGSHGMVSVNIISAKGTSKGNDNL